MKVPQEVKQITIDTLRSMESEIQDKERTLQGYLEVARETEVSLKELRRKKKEYDKFAKKIGVTPEDVGTFTPWNGSLPEVLTDEERNVRLAGIVDGWQKEETNV